MPATSVLAYASALLSIVLIVAYHISLKRSEGKDA